MEDTNENERMLCNFDKELTRSDIARQQNRLRLSRDMVEKDVLPALSSKERQKIKNGGIPVKVIDVDSNKNYDMFLAAWNDSKCYVIKGENWTQFIKHKQLREKDVIEVSVKR